MLKSEDANITLLSAEDFILSYKPPKFIIKNILQSGYITTVTAKIGDGKTALLTYMAFCVALGHDFGGYKTSKGNVIYVAVENDQDVIQRFAAQAQVFGVPVIPENLKVMTVDKGYDFLTSMQGMPIEIFPHNIDLVIIDTATAIYNNSNENDNVQQKEFASKIRDLVEQFPGNPSIVVACHPPKNSHERSSLVPRGGSALYGEIDCGITAVRKGNFIVLEPAEKFRGQKFSKIKLRITEVNCNRIHEIDGTPIKSVAILNDTSIPPETGFIGERIIYSDLNLAEAIVDTIKNKKNAKLSEIVNALLTDAPSQSEADQNAMKKSIRITIGELTKSSSIILKGKTYSLPSENK